MFLGNKTHPGTLFGQSADGASREAHQVESSDESEDKHASHSLAFAGLFLFTLLLYARPQELFPQIFGDLPLVKIIAIGTLLAYTGGKLRAGERFSIWPLEMKMLALILLLGLAFLPVAVWPAHSIDLLTDSFFKVITIFVLMVNLIDTRQRLHAVMRLVVMCGVLIALFTIKNYFTGELGISHLAKGVQTGVVGTYFDNTNELALMLDVLLPIAIVLGVTSKGVRRLGYLVSAAIIGTAAVMTFSRGGFLGLVSMGGVLMWKLGRGKRLRMVLAGLLLAGAFAAAMPSGYSERLFTILHPADDSTNSAQERQAILGRAVEVALHHPIIGIGLANFSEYSPNGKVAHNSYVEIAAELGWIGLLAYMIFLVAPFRSLKRIERGSFTSGLFSHPDGNERRELYAISVGLQAMIVAFMVCSFFASVQYSWHPYYIVGFSIALRRIYAARFPVGQIANTEAASPLTGGALWRSANNAAG
jgi:putative inorganic carbon (HCO3(-)) transporter